MARRKVGGAWFQNVDPVTGVTSWTGLSKFLFSIAGLTIVGLLIWMVVSIVMNSKSDGGSPPPSGGGAVAPPMSKLPGRITIAEVAQAPSAGQAIIYFSQAEAAGTTCDTCTATFDINLTYSGGLPTPSPVYKQATAPSVSGVVTFDYSVPTQTGGSTPITPTPPTQVTVSITARSVSNEDPSKKGSPTTFTKTLTYV